MFASLLVLVFLSLLTQTRIEVVHFVYLGLDFHDYYQAAQKWLAGEDPYAVSRFVTPPLSLLHAALLSGMGFAAARYVFMGFNVLLLLAVLRWVQDRLPNRQIRYVDWVLFAFASFPTQMLIERGNVDGVIMALLAGCLFAESLILVALCFVLAVLIKIYPLIFLPFLWFRYGRPFVVRAGVLTLLALLLFFPLFQDYVPNLLARLSLARFDENLSPQGLLYGLQLWFPHMVPWLPALLGALIKGLVAVYIGINVYLDWRLAQTSRLQANAALAGAAWLPAMLFFPGLVYAYSAVILFLLFAVLEDCMHVQARPTERWAVLVAEISLMFGATAYASVTGVMAFHAIPQIGLILLAILTLRVKSRLVNG